MLLRISNTFRQLSSFPAPAASKFKRSNYICFVANLVCDFKSFCNSPCRLPLPNSSVPISFADRNFSLRISNILQLFLQLTISSDPISFAFCRNRAVSTTQIGALFLVMAFGESWLHANSHICCSSATVKALSRVPGCGGTVILGAAVPEWRCVSKNASMKKRRVPAIHAAESRSVDATANNTTGSSHLDLLQRMTENSSTAAQGAQAKTIRDQLENQSEPEGAVVSLVNEEAKENAARSFPELTVSQKRNIRRQNYLNQVSKRNDAPFFAIVAATVLVPPVLILAFAVATGYIELFP